MKPFHFIHKVELSHQISISIEIMNSFFVYILKFEYVVYAISLICHHIIIRFEFYHLNQTFRKVST